MDSKHHRLYNELSWIWPLWGDPATEYAEFCSFVTEKMLKYAGRDLQTILNVGCGGGKNLFNLKKRFEATGLDLSPDMLSLARDLNPECGLIQSDMRFFDLHQEFDSILIDDAVSYMTNRDDLEKVFTQTYKHLKSGGVMCVTPDATTETFIQNQTKVFHSLSSDKYPETSVVYITNEFAADISSEQVETAFVFLIRTKGVLSIETDKHIGGLFPVNVWQELLSKTGYEVHSEVYSDEEQQYHVFFCVKP
jgi:SAM-dependent methyltransferase